MTSSPSGDEMGWAELKYFSTEELVHVMTGQMTRDEFRSRATILYGVGQDRVFSCFRMDGRELVVPTRKVIHFQWTPGPTRPGFP